MIRIEVRSKVILEFDSKTELRRVRRQLEARNDDFHEERVIDSDCLAEDCAMIVEPLDTVDLLRNHCTSTVHEFSSFDWDHHEVRPSGLGECFFTCHSRGRR